jgi:hypothetical protein
VHRSPGLVATATYPGNRKILLTINPVRVVKRACDFAMGKKRAKAKLRSTVVLTAYGDEGVIVEKCKISYDQFYEETNSLIDGDKHIRKSRIRVITGEIYNSSGKIQSTFTNFYNKKGIYARSRSIHADGTVFED